MSADPINDWVICRNGPVSVDPVKDWALYWYDKLQVEAWARHLWPKLQAAWDGFGQ